MSIDIVNLIEKNPITKLNGDYQSKLIEKVQKPLIIMNNKYF
jgi:hypothetical protein